MKNLDKKQIQTLVIVLVLMGLSFYAGTYFPSKKAGFGNNQFGMQGKNSTRQFNPNNANGGMTSGEVVSKDAQSISVKLRDGGSKIIFFSTSTAITKGTQGTVDDLAVGSQIMAVGTQNQDGSITAKTIQLRNDMPFGQNQGGPNASSSNPR